MKIYFQIKAHSHNQGIEDFNIYSTYSKKQKVRAGWEADLEVTQEKLLCGQQACIKGSIVWGSKEQLFVKAQSKMSTREQGVGELQ